MQRGFVDDGMQAGKRSPSANYYNSFYHSWNTFYLGDILLPMPMFSGERVGEASNPGPDFFTVSGTNAQSLNAFCDDGRLTSPHAEVLVYTETAATEFVQIKAKKLAHAANQHAVFSKAVRKRSFQDGRDCNTKGEAKGSAIVSKCPVRPTFSAWSTEAWDTARINDCYLITDSGNVLVIAMYGLHQGLPNAEEANQVRCPALIVGDLNCDLQQLNAWHAMVQAGWSDAALVQQQLDGLPAANTYKDVSRLDYVLMNDLARFAFRRFYLSPQDEADHRTVNAEFDWSGIPKQCKTFRMPLDAAQLDIPVAEMQHAYIPAKALDILDIAIRKGDIEEAWGAFCKAYEDGISFAMDKLGKRPPKTFLGRGIECFTRQGLLHRPSPAARTGEFQPSGDDDTVQLRQRFRQIRRFEAYIQQCKSLRRPELDDDRRAKVQQASCETWLAICNSAGFQMPFREWWFSNHAQWFPQEPPDTRTAKYMKDKLTEDEVQWRSFQRSCKNRKLSEVFSSDWKQGGAKHRAIRPPGMPRVDSLNAVSDHRILARRSRQKGMQCCTMQDEDLHLIRVGSVWKQGKSQAIVSSIQMGKVFLKQVKGAFISGVVSQHRPSSNPDEILKAAEDYWKGYWNAEMVTQMDDEMVQGAVQSLPQLQELSVHIDENDLQWALSALPLKKARGMDGFSNYELKNLPTPLRPRLVQLFNMFSQGLWPKTICKARMASLYKTMEVGDIASTRPITILATVYRVWAKILTRKVLQHIQSELPRSLYGSVPGKASTDMVTAVQLQLEKALIQEEPMAGISLDFSKPYNTLPRSFLQAANDRLGLRKLWSTYDVFLGNLERYFTCGPSWGHGITSTTGVPEGCPIAVVQMIILTWCFTNYIEQTQGVPLY